MLEWLSQEQNEVAVFDATNTTRERRRYLYQRVVVEKGFKLFFVESICNDPEIIEANILEVKVTSPDYKHFDKEQVLKDFLERIKHYSHSKIVIPDNILVEYKEALIFGLLGVLRARQEINCLSSVTGAINDHSSGVVFIPIN